MAEIALFGSGRAVPLAWRNLVSSKRRLIRSSAGIGFAVLLMLVQLGFEQGFFDASLGMVRELDGELFVMRASKYSFRAEDPFPSGDLDPLRRVAGIATLVPLYATWQHFFWKDPTGDKSYLVQAFAFDPSQQAFLLPELNAERDRLKQADAVIVDRRARPYLHMGSDARQTEINGKTVHIVGQYTLGPDFMSDGTVMMSVATYADLLAGNPAAAPSLPVEFGVVKVAAGAQPADVQKSIAAALPAELRVMTKPELVAFERSFQADLSAAGPIFWMGTLVGFVVGMLISYQIIFTDIADQLPQYATLKGMGYGTAYLVRIVFEQATLSAAAAYVPAWLLCLLVYRVVGELALLPLHMTSRNTVISLVLTLGMCLLSASLALRRVLKVDPAEVF